MSFRLPDWFARCAGKTVFLLRQRQPENFVFRNKMPAVYGNTAGVLRVSGSLLRLRRCGQSGSGCGLFSFGFCRAFGFFLGGSGAHFLLLFFAGQAEPYACNHHGHCRAVKPNFVYVYHIAFPFALRISGCLIATRAASVRALPCSRLGAVGQSGRCCLPDACCRLQTGCVAVRIPA